MVTPGIPSWLAGTFAGAGLAGVWAGPDEAAGLPARPGAYALALRLDIPVDLPLVELPIRSPLRRLSPGWHVYAGSARGPGGLAARLRRHFRPGKPVHWHIDRLTAAPVRVAALALPGAAECEIVARLLATGHFTVPVPGFGSTDCRRCESHLLAALPERRREPRGYA